MAHHQFHHSYCCKDDCWSGTNTRSIRTTTYPVPLGFCPAVTPNWGTRLSSMVTLEEVTALVDAGAALETTLDAIAA